MPGTTTASTIRTYTSMPSIHKKTVWNSTARFNKKTLIGTLIPPLPLKQKIGSLDGTSCQKRKISSHRQISVPVDPCLQFHTTALSVCPALGRIDQRKPARQLDFYAKLSIRSQEKVRFRAAKPHHEGIPPVVPPKQTNLERLVSEFCQKKPKMDFLMQLQYNNKHSDLSVLANELEQVIARVERSPKDRVPLLENGGGCGLFMKKRNLPCLKRLYSAAKTACKECMILVHL